MLLSDTVHTIINVLVLSIESRVEAIMKKVHKILYVIKKI